MRRGQPISTSPQAGPGAQRSETVVIPFFVCAGARPEPLGYATVAHGDDLEEMVTCPARSLCVWHAGHDLGGSLDYSALPEPMLLRAAFQRDPYFSCPNFGDVDNPGGGPPVGGAH